MSTVWQARGEFKGNSHQRLARGTGEKYHLGMEAYHRQPTRTCRRGSATASGFLCRPNYMLRSRHASLESEKSDARRNHAYRATQGVSPDAPRARGTRLRTSRPR